MTDYYCTFYGETDDAILDEFTFTPRIPGFEYYSSDAVIKLYVDAHTMDTLISKPWLTDNIKIVRDEITIEENRIEDIDVNRDVEQVCAVLTIELQQ